MPGVVRLATTILAVLAAGCATQVNVSFDDRHDFSADRSWDWLSQTTHVVGAPAGVDQRLQALTARLVEQGLQTRGLARNSQAADLVVTCSLDVKSQLVTTHQTGAVRLLASHHASPSYLIQTSTKRTDVYHDARLRLVFAIPGPQERVVWEGEVHSRQRDDLAGQLRAAVAELLREFPSRPAGPEPTPSSEFAAR